MRLSAPAVILQREWSELRLAPIPESTYSRADQPGPAGCSPRRAGGHRRHFEFAAAPIGFRWRSAFLPRRSDHHRHVARFARHPVIRSQARGDDI
jgi:hypothetical protein